MTRNTTPAFLLGDDLLSGMDRDPPQPLMIGCLVTPIQLRSGKLVTVPSIDVNEWLGGSVSVVGKSDRMWLPRLSSRAWAADTAAAATERRECVRSTLTNSVFMTGLGSLRATAVSCNCWMLAAACANPLAERDIPMWVFMVVAKLD